MEHTNSELAEKVDRILEILSKPTLDNKRWLRTDEAANYLSISTSQLHRLKRDGVVSCTKLGGTNYYDRQEIDQMLEERKAL